MEQRQWNRPIMILLIILGLTLSVGGLYSPVAAEDASPAMARPSLDQALEKYDARTQVSGILRVAGSDTMRPLMNRFATEFTGRQPNAKIKVEGGGSGVALPEFLNKPKTVRPKNVPPWHKEPPPPALVVASSRELTAEEIKQFVATHGYEPTAVPIAMDAVGIYVHKDNPIQGLSLEQLDAILSTTRKRGYPQAIKTWDQLNLGKGWEQTPIRLYGRNLKSGTRGFVKDHILMNGEFEPSIKEEPGAASVILALSRDSSGMAYSGIGLSTSSVRAIPLAEAEGKPFIEPSAQNVMNGTYPLRRFLYLYFDKAPDGSMPQVVEEFLGYIKSRDGQDIVMKGGFYPLSDAQLDHAVAAVVPTSPPARHP